MKTQIKSKVQALLDDYRTTSKEITAKVKQWEQDTVYSIEYRAAKVKELRQDGEKTDALFNSKLQQVIAEEKKVIIGEPSAKPADYEVKISNALRFLELAGDKLTDDQAYGILKPFESDPETMQLFQAVVGGLTEGQGVWGGFTKTFSKTNQFMVLLNSIEQAEDAASNLFDSKETGLGGAIKINMFMAAVDAIDELANGIAA